MVLLHLKNSEEAQFLFETPAATPVRDVAAALARVHNLRHRITRLKLEGEELAKYGPAKPPDAQGIDEYADAPVQRGEHYAMDPTGRRTGNACDPVVAKKLLQELENAAAAASKARAGRTRGRAEAPRAPRTPARRRRNLQALVARREPLTARGLEGAIDLVRGAVMICYPMGLPEWDFVRACLEGREDLAGSNVRAARARARRARRGRPRAARALPGGRPPPRPRARAQFGGVDLDPDTAVLWFAGKQLAPDRPLSEYVGRNERTRATVKLQKKGAGPPAREPALAQDEDDSYTQSSWASSKALKAHFSGVTSVRIPR
ncbi:CFAP298 [Scenedesmus sp. PABB004]|nr:CFAP298 [Scenedesmus sp. PABB004]